MPKDHFKTRLEIAKNKILKRSKISKDSPSSKLGIAFKSIRFIADTDSHLDLTEEIEPQIPALNA